MRSILVADGDVDRAKQIGEACLARGIDVRVAPHGAAALEMALAEVPGVLVVADDVALIPALRLAEILRANPRTQGVRVMWIGDTVDGVGPAYADEVVTLPVDDDDLARRVDTLLARQARSEAVERAREDECEVEGKLAQISLTDLLELFLLNRRTGTLELVRREGPGREERARIEVREGQVVHAVIGTVEGEKALFRLLGWRNGSFSFSERAIGGPARIRTPTRALLMEGMRQIDELARLADRLPPLDAEVLLRVKTAELPPVVQPLTQEVLLLLEIYSDVREIVDRCSHPDYAVLRTLQTLVDRGMLELRRRATRQGATSGGALFTTAQVRRLRDWVENGHRSGNVDVEAKLLVTASRTEGMVRFLRWLRHVPGARFDEMLRGGAFAPTPEAFVTLARVPVDATTSIEIVQVPVDPSLEPLWGLAAHRALASVHLIDGPLDEAERRLAPIVRSLAAVPASRCVPVRLAGSAADGAGDDTQERLSLFGNVSPLFAATEGAGDPRTLMRDLFARVIP